MRSRSQLRWRRLNVAALERSANVADRHHAFAVLKRGYPRRVVIVRKMELGPRRRTVRKKAVPPPPSLREGPGRECGDAQSE
jgi:hypothetical protein